MANHDSSKKTIRQNEKRYAVNRSRLSRIRTMIRYVERAIAEGDADKAQLAFRTAFAEMQRGVQKHVLRKNTVARKASRLVAKIKALQQGAAA